MSVIQLVVSLFAVNQEVGRRKEGETAEEKSESGDSTNACSKYERGETWEEAARKVEQFKGLNSQKGGTHENCC